MDDQIDFGDIGRIEFLDVEALAPHVGPEVEVVDDDSGGEAPAEVEAWAGGVVQQIDLPEAMDFGMVVHRPLRFVKGSAESAAYARQARATKLAKAKAEAASKELQNTRQLLRAVESLLPNAAQLIGRPAAKHLGRKKTLRPSDMVILCRAAHLASSKKLSLGVRHKSVICAAADLILRRQSLGLQRLIATMASARSQASGSSSDGGRKNFHITYLHMWDETKVKHDNKSGKVGTRKSRMGIHGHTLVQRGVVHMGNTDGGGSADCAFQEPWLALPMQVDSTAADSLLPAVEEGFPRLLSCADMKAVCAVADEIGSITIMPLCDKASSNLQMLRLWASRLQEANAELGSSSVLFFPDTCGIHSCARGKLVLHELRKHTMRHFSISNVYRLAHIRSRMHQNMESLVEQQIRRVVGPAPHGTVTLSAFVDVLFEMDAAHHHRGKGGTRRSQKWHDLRDLSEVVNGDLLSDEWVHHCWDPTSQSPCCASLEDCVEKATVRCVNALLSEADPVPSESRWTHLLSNMRKTLLRAAVHKVGLRCFEHTSDDGQELCDVDSAAVGGGSGAAATGVRAKRIQDYYGDAKNIEELAVFAVVLGVYDSKLLYPLLGNPAMDDQPAPGKLDKLLDERSSLPGECSAELLRLMQSWASGDTCRRPWLVLGVLRVPLLEEGMMRFARSQILRLASSVFRRFEKKYAAMPYALYPLSHDRSSIAQKRHAVSELLKLDNEELDCYSAGIRRRFPTEERLLSTECQKILKMDFAAHGFSTDLIERLHSEITHNIPTRAPNLSFTNLSRESLLKQAAVVHVARGGEPPLGARVLDDKRSTERLLVPAPLLPLLDDCATDESQPLPLAAPALDLRDECALELVARVGDEVNPVSSVAHTETGGKRLRMVSRPFVDRLVLTPEDPTPTKRKGLSPFMLERNKHMKAARELLDRPMTEEEIARKREEFRKFWEETGDHGSHELAYAAWRESAVGEAQEATSTKSYRTTWGGGSIASPISCREFFRYHAEQGWPSDKVVYDQENTATKVPTRNDISWDSAASVQLWSMGGRAHNVHRGRVLCVAQFKIVEKGLTRAIDILGKDVVDVGDTMLVIEGQSSRSPAERLRFVVLLTGVCYSPKVFEVARCAFADNTHKHALALPLPSRVVIQVRPCQVANKFTVVDFLTGDELVDELTRSLNDMELSVATHRVANVDGSLLWSEITGVKRLGCLWSREGNDLLGKPKSTPMERSLRAAQTAFKRMTGTDPLSAEASRVSSSGGHRAPRAAPGRGRAKPSLERQASARPPSVGGAQQLPLPDSIPIEDEGVGEGRVGPMGGVELFDRPFDVPAAEADFDMADQLGEICSEDSDGEQDVVGPEASLVTEKHGDAYEEDIFGDFADEATVAAVAAQFSEDGGGAARSSTDAPAEGVAGAEASPAAAAEAVAVAIDEPWRRLSQPSASGYVYDQARTVLRVQRDKPKGRCTITCYRHRKCNLLVNMNRCPENEDIFKWFFEVEPTAPEATSEEGKALTRKHLDLAAERWTRPRRPA